MGDTDAGDGEVLGRACPMDYHHSTALPTDIYLHNPDYFSVFRPRIHKEAVVADDASVEVQIEWYGKDQVGRRIGSMNAHAGNFTALCAPACIPERLWLVAYVIEFAFLHNDNIDTLQDHEVWLRENASLMQALDPNGTLDKKALSGQARREREINARMATELLSADPKFGAWFLKHWREFLGLAGVSRKWEFNSLDEYLAFRVSDAGCMWILSLIRWGTGIYLTPEEERTAGPMTYLGYAALSLTNDLFSWEKQKQDHLSSKGTVPLLNAVYILMKTESLTEEQAKLRLRDKLTEHEERYCGLRDEFMYIASSKPSEAVVRWFACLESAVAGNWVWSLKTKRYSGAEENPYEQHRLKIQDRSGRGDGMDQSVRYHDVVQYRSEEPTSGVEQTSNGSNRDFPFSIDSVLPSNSVVMEPYAYLMSLPSKNIRQTLIDALQTWYQVPERCLMTIQGLSNLLHNASLLFDDIQDGSALRRGRPAAHMVFGVSQVINSASYLINQALCLVQMLSPQAVAIYSEELQRLHLGQGYDLHWTFHAHVPTEAEYLSMVDGKTGGLFRLLSRIMRAESTQNSTLDITDFITLLGRHFQIRDDYQNLMSADYTTAKGFCEDLDEGKFSLPLIHALHNQRPASTFLQSVLQTRKHGGHLSPETKRCVLDQLHRGGSLEYTHGLLCRLQTELSRRIGELEGEARAKNWILRQLLKKVELAPMEADGDEAGDGGTVEGKRGNVWREYQRQAWVGVDRI